MQKIIFTDLDGTLTLSDTYTKLLFKNISLVRIFFNIWSLIKIFILYFLRIKKANDIKIETFRVFFTDRSIKELFENNKKIIDSISWNQIVIELIREEQLRNNTKVIIITASPDIYIKEICNYLGYDGYISTSVELDGNKLTGNFLGKICNFDEKVKRIESFLDNKNHYKISYGNSKGDYSMLKYCDESYFVNRSKIYKFNDYIK